MAIAIQPSRSRIPAVDRFEPLDIAADLVAVLWFHWVPGDLAGS